MTFVYKGREKKLPDIQCFYPRTITYDPILAGSIDGTDIEPHDAAVARAVNSEYKPSYKAIGNSENTIFIGRLSLDTTEKDLEEVFCRYGKMIALRLVRDIVTGLSKRYAFIEFETFEMALNTYLRCKSLVIKNSETFVDFECGRLLPGWKPRRLGGGFGGFKQSGQLRFGGRIRHFIQPLPLVNLKKIRTYAERARVKRASTKSSSSYKYCPRTHRNHTSHSSTSNSRSINVNPTTSAPTTITLPLTPPSNSTIILPLTPPSNSNVNLPLTPPSQPIIVLPLTPPSQPTVTLPLTPPSCPNILLPLTPPSSSNANM